MSEYIKREDAVVAVRHAWAKGLEPTQYVEAIPAADVVEVVRCKDCKWFFQDADNEPCCRNVCGLVIVTDEDFCSLGERRKNE